MKNTKLFLTVFSMAATLLAAFTLVIPSAQAASLTWDANATGAGQTDGAGVWDTVASNVWWTGSANTTWTSGDAAIFGAGGAGGAVTLASSTAVDSLVFNYFTGTYTLGSVGQTITNNNGITMNAGPGAVTIISPITLGAAQTWINNTPNTLTVNDGANSVVDNNGFLLTFKGNGPSQGKFNIARGNGITGGGGVTVDNAYLDLRTGGAQSINSNSGTTTVTNGSGILHNVSNIGTNNIILNGGVLDGYFNSGFTRALGTGNNQIQLTGGASGFGCNGSGTINLGGAGAPMTWGTATFNPSALVLGTPGSSAGTTTFAHPINLNGATRTVLANSSLNAGAISGVISNSTGTAGLIKTGVGNLVLSAANTYNGDTTINGGSITLSGSGTINSTTALNLIGGGTLRLVNTANTQRFADGAGITNTAGGAISYENTANANIYSETLGAISLSGGQLNVVETTAQTATNSQTLTLGGLTQSGTAAVTFSAAGTGPQTSGLTNMIVVSGAGTTTAGEIIGPWATTGTNAAAQTDYAVYNANYVVPAAIAASAESAWATTWAIGENRTMANAANATTLTATRNINSVRASSTANGIASVDTNSAAETITVTSSTFADGDVVTFGGTPPGGLTTGQPYYVVSASGDTFSVASTSGGTKINLTSAGTGPNITGGIAVSSGTNFGTYGILNAQASGLAIGGSGSGVVTLPTTSAGNLYVTPGNGAVISIGVPIADNGAGLLTLVKNGSATLRLYTTNTYTGDTAINAGTLQIGVNGIANGANLGGGIYAGNIFIAGGATLDFQSNANQTNSGVISGNGSLVKRYSGTLTLSGNNTYTGKTSLTGLTTAGSGILSVSSFNSVNGGTPLLASSSLGCPTTVANGTIELGGGTQSTDTLKYTGGGETTDRIINFNFNSTATRVLDASGAGKIKFTNAPTSNGTGTSSVTLQGTGDGEFVGGLPFVFNNFTKSGNGTWTLGGAVGNTGTTTISAGTLIINGTKSGTGAVAVNGTSTLGGSGTVGGPVTVAAGANLAPGASVGTLTFTGNLTNSAQAAGAGKLIFELGPTNASDKIVVGGTLAIGSGVLGFSNFTFTALGGLQNGTYTLITSGAAISGTLDGADLTGTVGSGSGTLQTNLSGTDIELLVTGVTGGPTPPTPSLLTNSVTGGGTTLSLSWPASQGWKLQQQTNALSVGLRTNWVDVTDSSVSSTNITVDKTKPTTFYRLVYP